MLLALQTTKIPGTTIAQDRKIILKRATSHRQTAAARVETSSIAIRCVPEDTAVHQAQGDLLGLQQCWRQE